MKYLKKQIKIEAIQWNGDNIYEVIGFCKGAQEWKPDLEDDEKMGPLYINTLEGKVEVKKGDYIVQGIKGEFYPVSENKFNEIYEHYCESTYIKRPIEVEAFQLSNVKIEDNKLFVKTTDDRWLEASINDYLVKENNNCFHPVKPDIFEKTYKEVK